MTSSYSHAADGLIATIKENLPDEPEVPYDREKLKVLAQRLILALEMPEETAWRIGFLPMQTTAVRVGNKLDIYRILDKADTTLSVEDLAHKVNADSSFLLRLLRYLAAVGVVDNAGENRYKANNITKNLTVPQLAACVNHCHDIFGPSLMALPSFLARTGYRSPIESARCPFQDGVKTEEVLFDWLPKHPEFFQNFTLFMTGMREGRPTWLDFFPFDEQLLKGFEARGNSDEVIIVDVGGGIGNEVEQIKRKYPQITGKFVLQDKPDTVQQALKIPGMQVMPHDFFAPQPIEGARAYYLRSILHNWPDNQCRTILSHIASAMTRGYSKIIINELIVPVRDASQYATQLDLAMMVILAGAERSKQQWLELAESAGLQITRIWTLDPAIESIIELELK